MMILKGPHREMGELQDPPQGFPCSGVDLPAPNLVLEAA